ncbi:hypothetical protein [Dyadobacter psychrotolerans]|uniref:DUF4421 domain-containing protein n=1 Tax=Dyadobacter psychrotolerans TaxID=2541721 RepID=A0A4R5DL57_9BACT|nr:hypothetical protein [Dyadobacter psychrotolerans]TDE14809.1 hypothetical protein E0F88_16635 [Dyadobacter psychrotolerans]
MRLYIISFLVFFYCQARSQDSLSFSYSQQADTLINQRFIDRYENVFMTKVPTRHMFKVGLSQYYQAIPSPLLDDKLSNNTSLHLGYEFKFLPSFSVALSGHLPYLKSDQPLRTSLMYTVLDAQLRWFFDMRKRVKAGKAASNFSGNYVAFYYNMPGTFDNAPNIGIKLGFQRRFLNSGFMDFAVAIQNEFDAGFTISTQSSFGLAFGDWKKSPVGPLCDVLLCDEHLNRQWKVRLPELTFGYYFNRIRFGVAFEQKIKTSPLSLNFELNVGMTRGFDYLNQRYFIPDYGYTNYLMLYSKELFPTLTFQPRYYLLHKKRRLNGQGGYGFSGIYTGLNSDYSYYLGNHSYSNFQIPNIDLKKHIIKAGPVFGFQQRVFRHGYLDINTSLNYQNQALISTKHINLKTSVGLGFAW